MIASLVEQRACPMSGFLIVGLILQFVNIVLTMYFLPLFQPNGMSDADQLYVMRTIAAFNLFSLIAIGISALSCPEINLEDGLAAVFGFVALVATISLALESPGIWKKAP